MAVGFPTKVTYANGDVYSAGDVNDTNGTLNLLNPTAKGSLVSASAANTPSRLTVGANNLVLTADSAETTGLKWTGGWISYTPTWTASTTDPVLGNGSLTGGYRRIGDQVDFWLKLTAGSTTTFGVGTYRLSLPVAGLDSSYVQGFSVGILDAGTAWYVNYMGQGQRSGLSSSFECTSMNTSADWTTTAPFTFGNTDSVTVQGSYRVA
jgi:hypothetical protein